MKKDYLGAFGLLVLRVASGLFMLLGHGWPKLAKFSELADKFPDPLGMGSQLSLIAALGAEVLCSILLILGLGTRLAAVPLAFTMGVALLLVHGADPWQKKELAAVYLVVYVALVLTGGGWISLDGIIRGRKQETPSEPS